MCSGIRRPAAILDIPHLGEPIEWPGRGDGGADRGGGRPVSVVGRRKVILVVLHHMRKTFDDLGVRSGPVCVRNVVREILPQPYRVESRGGRDRRAHQTPWT